MDTFGFDFTSDMPSVAVALLALVALIFAVWILIGVLRGRNGSE